MIAIVCVFSVLFGLAVGTITTAVIVADRKTSRKPTYVFRDAPDPDYYFEPISVRSIDKAMEIMDDFGEWLMNGGGNEAFESWRERRKSAKEEK